jgi:hypothetical protein
MSCTFYGLSTGAGSRRGPVGTGSGAAAACRRAMASSSGSAGRRRHGLTTRGCVFECLSFQVNQSSG